MPDACDRPHSVPLNDLPTLCLQDEGAIQRRPLMLHFPSYHEHLSEHSALRHPLASGLAMLLFVAALIFFS